MSSKYNRIFLSVLIVVVVGAIAAGFWQMGSPSHQRQVRMDEERLNNIRAIDSAIINSKYYQNDHALPESLSQLETLSRDTLKDPEGGEPYEYRVLSTSTYEICATFATDNSNPKSPRGRSNPWLGQEWRHPAGHYCYYREVGSPLNVAPPPMSVPAK
ncbi:MAG: hypothetical protein HY978_04720 [Candidatus Liptonbacteria bacterium]|nr:hypothetical protein [Candidatus Liptonbacteria bacterium]